MTIFYLLTFIVCGAYLTLMVLYFIGWQKTPVHRGSGKKGQGVSVSIILPVRNEEKNILRILTHLSNQDYPKDKYEIIAVDDLSEDKTAELIKKVNISNLKLIQLTHGGGKKQAITEGISKASGHFIITTDADCEMGENWLSSIVSFYEEHKPAMIVAPVVLTDENGFQQLTQAQEMTVLTASACASLYYNLPVLCSGANLAYEKEAFIAVNGFHGVAQTATGDDVFLMLKLHKKFPRGIKYLKSKEAAVYTLPEKKVSSALGQRKRWASKSFSYGFSHVTGIALLVFLANFFIFLAGILSVINVKFVLALVVTLPLKCIVDYMLLTTASSFFGKKTHAFVFVLVSIIYPVYVSAIGLVSPFTHYSWKGRKS